MIFTDGQQNEEREPTRRRRLRGRDRTPEKESENRKRNGKKEEKTAFNQGLEGTAQKVEVEPPLKASMSSRAVVTQHEVQLDHKARGSP